MVTLIDLSPDRLVTKPMRVFRVLRIPEWAVDMAIRSNLSAEIRRQKQIASSSWSERSLALRCLFGKFEGDAASQLAPFVSEDGAGAEVHESREVW